MNQKLKKFLKRLLVYNIVIWVVIGVSIPVNVSGPSQYKYSDNDWDDFSYSPEYNETEWNVLLDPHSHTLYSDGSLTPRQNLLWHIAMGFNAMVLSDHNTFEGIDEIREIARNEFNDTIKVLAGMEWTTARVHLNFIFPPDTTMAELESTATVKGYASRPTDQEIEEAISKAHAVGGVVLVNHYTYNERLSKDSPTREQLLNWGVDFFEIINQNRYYLENHEFCIDNGLGVIVSTDMHEPEPVYGWTTLNVSEFTEEAIFNELEERRTGYIHIPTGSTYDVEHQINKAYIVSFPLIQIGEIFEDAYSSTPSSAYLGVIFVYIYGIFFLVEVSRYFIPKIKERLRNRKEKL
jgi:histidinol phosphatase-like PHP family hydrolase